MKNKLISLLAVLICGVSSLKVAAAVTIVQGGGANYVAYEADTTATILPGTPESWVSTNDATASGGTALYAGGTNDTTTSPQSFAQYSIKWTVPGTYYLYYRWKADAARNAGDIFTGNSSWLGITFGAYSTLGDQTPFYRSDSNNGNGPTNTTFYWRRELDTQVYTVSQGQVDAGTPLIFTIGTREAGMSFDRFVFSTVADLTQAQLDATVNSGTDVVLQGPTDNFAAFEADGAAAKILPGTPESWVSTNDATASGGTALYAGGTNDTTTSPQSFAQYSIKWTVPGTYYLYYRWKADAARNAGDIFTGNSTWLSITFGAYSTPGDQTPFYRSDSNNGNGPTNTTFYWRRELDTQVYTVSQAEVDAGTPLIFTIGTREAGMSFDRFVFSTVADLTQAQLDATPNSGAQASGLQLKKAVGSASLTQANVFFNRPLAPASVQSTDFVLSGGVGVTAAAVDAGDARKVNLTTSAQTQGTVYTVTVNGVTDDTGSAIGADSTVNFTAWKLAAGWVTHEVYFGIPGATVADLTAAPNYPDSPDQVSWSKTFALDNDPLLDQYGARLSAFFKPAAGGAHEFFVNNDDEAELQLSSNQSSANLVSLGTFPLKAPPFDATAMGTSPSLTAGQDYLLVGLLKQDAGAVYLQVGVRPPGSTQAPATLPILGGNLVSTFVNPDIGTVTFKQQPSNVITNAGSRARFSVKATADESPIYYQWRVNGTPIPGATLAAYVTPVLTQGDSGKTYDVVVSVAGKDTPSTGATLTVNPGQISNLQPYLGINFVGGGTGGGASLAAADVAGVVQQENWNNLTGFAFAQAPLVDAANAATPVTLSTDPDPNAPTEAWYTGTKSLNDGDGLLLQGFVNAVASVEPIVFRLGNVPAGTYNVLVYSVGFDFSANYYQAYSLTGTGSYPTYHGKSETGLNYVGNPAFRRMSTTTTNAPASGNYVQFDNVSPAGDGSLAVTVTWEPPDPAVNNSHQPAINAIQLVKVNAVTVTPSLGATVSTPGTLTISWSAAAAGFTLQSSPTLGTGAIWTPPSNPIVGAGSTNIATTSGAGAYYRLFKP